MSTTPIEDVKNDDLTPKAMLSFVAAAIGGTRGMVNHNIERFNALADTGLARILTEHFKVERRVASERVDLPSASEGDKQRKTFIIEFSFNSVELGVPKGTAYLTGQVADLHPNRARLTGHPYSAPVTLGATVKLTALYDDGRTEEKSATIPPFTVGNFPVMVGSNRCHLQALTREGLKGLGEDPCDPGGYFIAKGGEWVVDLLENICFNRVLVHQNMTPREHVRAEFLSQPGGAFENSAQICVRYHTNGQLTVEINSTKYEKVRLPFFLLYRLFGVTSDRRVIETIVADPSAPTPAEAAMLEILETAFQTVDAAFAPIHRELDHEQLVQFTAERLSKYLTNPAARVTNEGAVQFLNEDLLGSPTRPGGLDKIFLPHMGQTADARWHKLRFLGHIIERMLLVHLGVLPPTDRDSYQNKRVHGAGESLAKAFKTQFNNSIVSPLFKALRRLLANPWEDVSAAKLVETFRAALTTSDLNRAMEEAITSGNKEVVVVKNRAAMNRVSSQALERKNQLNMISALRTVVTQNSGNSSKQTARADEMRRVHPSYVGYICIAQSAESGENVGMRKQLAVTAGVCGAGEVAPLRLALREDPAVLPLDALEGAAAVGVARVFVNGAWVGFTRDAPALAARYRALRRAGAVVEATTSIVWAPLTNEVEFWLDVGRLRRPLLIVDSNLDAYDARCRERFAAKRAGREPAPPLEFVQNVRFTLAHARALLEKRLTLQDLIAEGVAEWVTPEEHTNALVAPNITALRAARHDVTRRYTHCDIEQAMFGIVAHVSPFANHTQPARVTIMTSQARQSCGVYANNFPFRVDKNRFVQWYTQMPLVQTFIYNFIQPSSANTIIAYASYGGDNQEDSAIMCRASADRGLFAGVFFRLERVDLEKDEKFETPNPLTTKNIKPSACYEKLVDGFVRPGATIVYGDVIVGRVTPLKRTGAPGDPDERFTYVDNSVVWRRREPAIVEAVYKPRGPDDRVFAIVKLRHDRPLRMGDKLSSRSGNKCYTPDHEVLTAAGWRPIAAVAPGEDVAALIDGRPTFAPALEAHTYDYDGLLVRAAGPGVDLLVTANHRMWAKWTPDGAFEIIPAEELAGRRTWFETTPVICEQITGLHENAVSFETEVECAWTEAPYRGPVHCLTVRGGLLFVRRRGTARGVWCGNSIVARMMSQSDMPFTESGLTPDIIINPHCFPSRMMVGQVLETLVSKVCARKGALADGTVFLPRDQDAVTAQLLASGFRYNGRERMYNGITGNVFDVAIFIGPTAEQRLQKFVLDDEQAVGGSAPLDATTGQPLGGKSKRGGLRLGEMESWGLVGAHGAAINAAEKMGRHSDGRMTYVCRCGIYAEYNERQNVYFCRNCGELADISAVPGARSSEVFYRELAAANIQMRLGLRPRRFETPYTSQ
jgi:DNA-directed RNA polymerase beta subunit